MHFIQLGITLHQDLVLKSISIDFNSTDLPNNSKLLEILACSILRELKNSKDSLLVQDLLNELNIERHPYTCAGHGIKECKREQSYEARRNGQSVPYTDENEGVLISTERGWICPCGKYTQDTF